MTSQKISKANGLPSVRKNKINVVSFFSGCGGLDLGFKGGFEFKGSKFPLLPFEIIKAYEFDKKCKDTYELNIGKCFELIDLHDADVIKMPAANVLIGGFPCQDYSVCGLRKGISTERGQLYRAMTRYVKQWLPKIVVAENVPHLPRINGGADFRIICDDFASLGYRRVLWNLYAPDYGVPQARRRIVVLFIRDDLQGEPKAPVAKFSNAHRGVEWAIGDLLNISDESVANQSQYFKAAVAGRGHGQGDEVSPRHLPGYTVRANHRSRVHFHYELPRRLTVRECARLQTFPDNFIFPHEPTPSIKQIGNAVPPVLAHVVASTVARFLATA